MNRKEYPLCAYCNAAPGDTRDHVIARAFFKPPLPVNMRTVRACKACNDAKAVDERDFRDMVVVDAAAQFNPIAQYLRDEPFLRSASYGSSLVANAIVTGACICPYYSKGGVYLGDYPSVSVEGGPVVRTLERVVRGMFFLWMGVRLPTDLHVEVCRVPAYNVDKQWAEMTEAGAGGPGGYRNVFEAKFFPGTDNSGHTYWMIRYYWGVAFTVETYPHGARRYGDEDAVAAS